MVSGVLLDNKRRALGLHAQIFDFIIIKNYKIFCSYSLIRQKIYFKTAEKELIKLYISINSMDKIKFIVCKNINIPPYPKINVIDLKNELDEIKLDINR